MIGQTINNYLIQKKLGDGGMGIVYLARHNRVDREVAIKVLHSNLFSNETIRNRFKNEANALIKLNHPNIVKIFDYVEQDNFACLIMEYINGYTLDEYMARITGPLPSEKAIALFISVLDAVQYAHDNNIYHRDIKPNNLMISRDGKIIRMMDFGIAKLTNNNFNATTTNVQLGTPFYMSPEQVKGMNYTNLSDIYSLGVTLFEMVTGKCPYQEITNLFELQNKIVNEPLPSTSLYYPDVSKHIQEAISIATNKKPEKRFQSCNQFKQFLLQQNVSVNSPVTKVSIPVKAPVTFTKSSKPEINKSENNNNAILIIFGIVAFFIVSLGIYFMLNQNNENIVSPPIEKSVEKQKTYVDTTKITTDTNSKKVSVTEINQKVTATPKPESKKFTGTKTTGNPINTNNSSGTKINLPEPPPPKPMHQTKHTREVLDSTN